MNFFAGSRCWCRARQSSISILSTVRRRWGGVRQVEEREGKVWKSSEECNLNFYVINYLKTRTFDLQ